MNSFQAWYYGLPKALRAILTITVGIYLLWIPLSFAGPVAAFVRDHLALNTEVPRVFLEPWQFITYMFLHLQLGLWGVIHVLFNMLWLSWIGREYEELHGPHHLLALYLLTGVGAGLLTVALFALTGAGAAIGTADGAVLGVMTAVAVRYPYKSIALFLLGTVRLVWVVVGYLVIITLFSGGNLLAVALPLTGAFCGFLYAKADEAGIDLASWARVFFREQSRARRRAAEQEGMLNRVEAWLASRGGARTPKERGPATVHPIRTDVAVSEADSLEHEVDRILEKISAHGKESLTEEEWRTLRDASQR